MSELISQSYTFQDLNLNDKEQLCLHLADNALILGHRNSEWTGHGPILEQDIAISNIALDLIGQARNFYQYAANLISERTGSNVTEDSLAYLRDAWDFRNLLLVEQTNGDWAKTILRQYFFSNYQCLLYEMLQNSKDSQIAAISEKSLKEVKSHLRWCGEWVIRLGDGTPESHERMLRAIQQLWKFTGELFVPAPFEEMALRNEEGADLLALKGRWEESVRKLFEEATLPHPSGKEFELTGGKTGKHTEELGYILAEMQFLQRAYPGCEW